MKKILLPLLACLYTHFALAQNSLPVIITDANTQETMIGASVSVKGTTIGASTDENGFALITGIPDGVQTIMVSYIGYEKYSQKLTFPFSDTLLVALSPHEEEMENIMVTSTRSTRTIADIPTRIEAIAGEELEEKGNMNSSNISMLLKESTGIQVQQTSAVSANMSFRIQGLDGRYTQLLQNGLPLYSGFSSGLSVMQIPPLDLQRVEIIKGSASTLYGGGAIAGMINLITKEPTDERSIDLQVVGNTGKGVDFNGFYSEKYGKVGLTVFSSYHIQSPYDANDDQFSDIPKQRRFNFNPRLFLYLNEKTTASFGVNTSFAEREGGFVPQIEEDANSVSDYTERNSSTRIATQLKIDHKLGECSHLFLKNSVSYFDRKLSVPSYQFIGEQISSFSELGYAVHGEKLEWVTGINLWTNQFRESPIEQNQTLRDYNLTTFGAFLQNTWTVSEKLALETGIRVDYQNELGGFVLPKVSVLYKWNEKLTSRLGGGLGYQTPTVFIDESERVLFRDVRSLNFGNIKAETSEGLNFDVNYETVLFGKLGVSLNQLFFVTRLNKTLIPNTDSLQQAVYSYENANGNTLTRGFETNLKLVYGDFKIFAFYSFIDTERKYNNLNSPIPLTPKHRTGTIFVYEEEDKWLIGYEIYYTGTQQREDGSNTKEFTTMGFMMERKFELPGGKMFSIYFNAENFLDTRLSNWQPMYTGTLQNPQFTDQIYAPTDGRILSLGFKIKL